MKTIPDLLRESFKLENTEPVMTVSDWIDRPELKRTSVGDPGWDEVKAEVLKVNHGVRDDHDRWIGGELQLRVSKNGKATIHLFDLRNKERFGKEKGFLYDSEAEAKAAAMKLLKKQHDRLKTKGYAEKWDVNKYGW